MKKFLIIALSVLTLSAVAQSQLQVNDIPEPTKFNGEAAAISWENDLIDVGSIKHNEPVDVEFEFTNIGNEPLVVVSVKTSCGCTTSYYPEQPIQPGEVARIGASYNAKNLGAFSKTVTVTTNASENPKKLVIKGVVVD